MKCFRIVKCSAANERIQVAGESLFVVGSPGARIETTVRSDAGMEVSDNSLSGVISPRQIL